MTRHYAFQCLSAAIAATGLFFVPGCDAQVVSYEPVPVYRTYTPVYGQPVYGAPQVAQPPMQAPVAGGTMPDTGAPRLTAEQLDTITAPIALYPDPLLAQLLPATTYPDDIIAANDWLQRNPQPREEDINAQTWDPSVKALVHYPTAFNQLAGNMQWTQTLGSAFLAQQQDVMDSIQRLRLQAQSAGNLNTTAQQEVVTTGGYVEILPADTQYLYVPVYDPYVVFVRPARFSYDPCYIGGWLSFGFDWHSHHISRGWDWSHHRRGDWDRDHWDGRRGDWNRTSASRTNWTRDNTRTAPRMPVGVSTNRTDLRRGTSIVNGGRTSTNVQRSNTRTRTQTQFGASTPSVDRSSDWQRAQQGHSEPQFQARPPVVQRRQPVQSSRSMPDIRSIPSSTPRQMPSWSHAAPQRTVQPRAIETPRAAPSVSRPTPTRSRGDNNDSGSRGEEIRRQYGKDRFRR